MPHGGSGEEKLQSNIISYGSRVEERLATGGNGANMNVCREQKQRSKHFSLHKHDGTQFGQDKGIKENIYTHCVYTTDAIQILHQGLTVKQVSCYSLGHRNIFFKRI